MRKEATVDDVIKRIVNEKNEVLVEACEYGDLETVKELLEHDPDISVNFVDFDPLRVRPHYLIDDKQLKFDKVTIDYHTNEAWNPFMTAVRHGQLEVLEYLLRNPNLDAARPNVWGETALHVAIVGDQIDALRVILKSCPSIDINFVRNDGKTALAVAAALGRRVCLELLLAAPGIDVNKVDRDNRTPLHLACLFGKWETMRVLVDDPRVDVNTVDVKFDSPLMSACRALPPEPVARLLQDPRINVEETNKLDKNLLYIAVDHGRAKIVKVLLKDPRIDVNKPDQNMVSPLHLATRRLTSPLETWKAEYRSCLKLLLSSPRVNVNIRNKEGCTPFFWAARENHPRTMRLLLAFKRVDPNATDLKGRTPLWAAATGSSYNVVKELLMCPLVDLSIKPDGKTSILREMDRLERPDRTYELMERYIRDPEGTRKYLMEGLDKDKKDDVEDPLKDKPKYIQKIARKREKKKLQEEEAMKKTLDFDEAISQINEDDLDDLDDLDDSDDDDDDGDDEHDDDDSDDEDEDEDDRKPPMRASVRGNSPQNKSISESRSSFPAPKRESRGSRNDKMVAVDSQLLGSFATRLFSTPAWLHPRRTASLHPQVSPKLPILGFKAFGRLTLRGPMPFIVVSTFAPLVHFASTGLIPHFRWMK